MKYKKVIAVSLAATMAIGSSMAAFAADTATTGNAKGIGKVEGTVNKEVFHVVVPTVPEGGALDSLKFILDPEGLIEKTSNAAYSGKSFETGSTLFFSNASGTPHDYSSVSDALTITNRSSVGVDVSLSAKVSGAAGINLSEDKTFQDDKKASIYLAIQKKGAAEATPITSAGVNINETIPVSAKAGDNYEYKYDAGTGYSYDLKDSYTEADFNDAVYEFQLTGAANANGDWSAFAGAEPAVDLTWNVALHSEGYASSKTVSTINNNVTLTVPEGVSVHDITFIKADGVSTLVGKAGTHYTLSGNKLSFTTTTLGNNLGGKVVITYTDGHADVLAIQ